MLSAPTEGTRRPDPLKATARIGGATQKINYGIIETAFAPGDVPDKAVEARRAVRRSKRPNLLGVEKQSWNQSTVVAAPLCKRATRQMSKHDRNEYRYNYRAEVLPAAAELITTDVVTQRAKSALTSTKRVEELPVNPSLSSKPGWNASTQFTTEDKSTSFARTNKAAFTNTSSKTQRLKGYKKPTDLYKADLDRKREAREKGTSTMAGAGAMVMSSPPETDLASSHQPMSYTMTVSRKFKKYHHSGTYQPSRFDKGHAWSCCMATEKNARGCIVTVVNPDAWNFVSIN